MKITEIVITHHELPLSPSFKASWDGRERASFEATIVRVRTDEGLEGWGSGDQMLGFKGHEELFIGQDPLRIERHFSVLSNIDFHYGRCWPLDLALWDLAGKIAGLPVWKMLGGRRKKVRPYASSGTLKSPSELADSAEMFIELGFEAMKVRFQPGGIDQNLKALEFVRQRIGDKIEVMVDCNQGWRMPWDVNVPWQLKDALQVARELERLGVYWMEEPLHHADIDGMRRLKDAVDMRIAGGEMTRSLDSLSKLASTGALDVLQPDAALVGGITGLRKIAAIAEASGVMFSPHTWTNGAGVIANLHLTAGVSNATYLEYPFDPPAWSLDRRDFLMTDPLELSADGFLALPDSPGMGYSLNEELLEKTRLS